jgi:hypothetical protein
MKLLQGRTGTDVVSAFVKFLSMLFCCEIDVSIGNVDVIQSAIANLYIDLAVEEHTQDSDEGRYHSSSSAAFEPFQQAETYNPSCNMPMWRATTLILGLHTPLIDNEIFVAKTIREEIPNAPHQVIHV